MSSWYYIVIQVIMLYEERTEYMIQKMDETIQHPLALDCHVNIHHNISYNFTHLSRMELPSIINWTSPLPF